MHFQIDLSYVLNDLLKVAIPVAMGYVANILRKYVIAHLKGKYARIAVRLAMQAGKDLDSKGKYHKAIEWFVPQLKKFGIKVTEDEVEGWIEQAYVDLKSDLNESKVTSDHKNGITIKNADGKSVATLGDGGIALYGDKLKLNSNTEGITADKTK